MSVSGSSEVGALGLVEAGAVKRLLDSASEASVKLFSITCEYGD